MKRVLFSSLTFAVAFIIIRLLKGIVKMNGYEIASIIFASLAGVALIVWAASNFFENDPKNKEIK